MIVNLVSIIANCTALTTAIAVMIQVGERRGRNSVKYDKWKKQGLRN